MIYFFETINNILSITSTTDSTEKAGVQYDSTLAKNNILKLLQHIIRHAQQDEAKQDCLEGLSNQTNRFINSRLLSESFVNGFL